MTTSVILKLICIGFPIGILLFGPQDALAKRIWRREPPRMWHVETLVVMLIMSAVAIASGNNLVEWIGFSALCLAHGRNSVMIRMSESQVAHDAGNPHHVECHAWATWYLWFGEVFWACYFLAHKSWSALCGVGVFALFPIWRRWYSKSKRTRV